MLSPTHAASTEAVKTWNSLASWLSEWFESPDLEGLKVCLCAAATHYYDNERPLWILAIGNQGSGKTEIIIQTLRNMPKARVIGNLTPKCFMSSYAKQGDKREGGMLATGGPSQIWMAKDFTTFGSMRYEDRSIIAAQLREIWDGELVSDTGVQTGKVWRGKVTMIAVATPGFERHWAALSDLGERFMTVRWREGNRQGAMRKGRRQAGKEELIREVSQSKIMDLLENRATDADMPDDLNMRKRDAIAEVVCQLRRHVAREASHGNPIVEVSAPEFPTRVSMALSQIVRTHMDLFHRTEPGPEEYTLAERLAIDTIPVDRLRILECIPPEGGVKYGEILKKTRIPDATIRRRLEDLIAINTIEPYDSKVWTERIASLTGPFRELLADAGLQFHGRGEVVPFPIVRQAKGHKASFLG